TLLAGPAIAMSSAMPPAMNGTDPLQVFAKSGAADATDSERFRDAAVRGDTSSVAAFLDRDPALLYARDARDVSAFRLAALSGQTQVTDVLRTRGLVLDLFDAATVGDEQRLTDLYRADPGIVRARTRFGTPVLTCAAQAGQSPIVEFLLGRGAEPNANVLDKDGKPLDFTALRVALDYSKKEMAEKMA